MKQYLLSLFLLLVLTKGFSQNGIMDNFDDNTIDPGWQFLLSCPAPLAPCYTGTETNSELQVVTNAVGPAYENFEFQFPAINLTANPVVKINVKNSVAFNMRIDLTDKNGYATNASPTVVAIPVSASYVQYTFNFTGKFSQTTPTAQTVDMTQIVKAVIFINPGGSAMSTTLFLNDLIVGNPPTPTASFTQSATSICTGAPVVFTNTSSNGISSYTWNFGSGATPATATTYGPHSVTWSTPGTKTITLSVTGPGGTSTAPAGSVVVNGVPSAAGTVAGSSSQCNGSTATYSLTAVTGATGYTWSLPPGATITAGNNTNNVTISFGSSGGNIAVTPTNSCGNGNISPNLPITINPSVTASVSITASPSNSICTGNSVTFTASPVNGGTSPTYQWKINGTTVATGPSYTTTSLANGNVVTATMVSNAPCVAGSPATSNSITMNVSSGGAPTISISTTTPTICSGGVVIFSSTVTNGGPSPSFVWKQNGVTLVGENNDSLMATLVNDQDVFYAIVTASGCAAGSATSNLYQIAVTPGNLANVFATTYSDTVCIGVPTTFTATPTNGGTSPVYQWQVNGANVGTNSPTYTATINTNSTVTVTMTSNSNAACLTNNPATATPLDIKAVSTMTSAIKITATATTICSGLPITFTATPQRNGGTSPSYQWKINGTNVSGATSPTFTSSTLANNDQVSCTMTSSISCAQPSTSNVITIAVTSTVAPSVSISTPSSSVCTGNSATFTATPTNGGSNPSYEWQINGITQSAVLSTFTPSTISNGDVIKAIMTSNLSCASTPTATSNSITMTVNPSVTPTLSITASQTTICQGTSVTFTANASNIGTASAYVWKENGFPTSATGPTYTVANLANNDVITCEITPNHPCGPTTKLTSNGITITVNPAVSALVTVSSSPTNACPSTATTFTAVPSNGGTTPVYQWKLNGNNVGTNSTTYSNSGLVAGDVVNVVMTSNAACVIGSPANSNSKTVSPAVTATISIAASANPVCTGTIVNFTSTISGGGSNPAYQWMKNGTPISGETSANLSTTVANNDVITCVLTSNAVCVLGSPVTSNGITMSVTSIPSTSVSITTPTPSICGGSTATFTATPVNAGANPNYQWQINTQNVGTNSATFSASNLANSDAVRVIMTSTAACAGASSTSNVITMVVSNPPSAANAGSDQYVTTTTATLSATPAASGTGQWTTSGGALISPASSASASVSNLAQGANTFTWTITSGNCTATSDNVVINVGSKPTTKTIAGPVNVLVGSTGITYSVASQAGSNYSWFVSGATLATGQGTNTITVDFGSTAGGVDIFLTEFNNYGDYTTTLHVNTGPAPTQKTISGPDYALINTSGITYSIPAIGGSTYSWTVTGATPASGTSNSIDLTFGGTPGTVTLSVTETNLYGSMTATKTVSVGTAPATPLIIGPDSVVTGTTVTYSVALHSGSTYSWIIPSGATATGSNTNTIDISFATGSYTLTVLETNASGQAVGQKFNIKAGTVATVASISGTTDVTAGIQYTYTAMTNAGGHSIFYWNLPAGTTVVSGLGTSTIKVVFPNGIGNTSISVTQDNGFGTSIASLGISMAGTGIWNTSNNSIAYTMFPNPFMDAVNVTFTTPVTSRVSLSIINMNGEVVYSSNEYSTNENISLGNGLPAGLYIIKAISDAKAQVIKINKE